MAEPRGHLGQRHATLYNAEGKGTAASMLEIPSYYDLEGQAVRWLDALAGPEIYRGDGVWEKYTNLSRLLMQASVITQAALAALVKEHDDIMARQGRPADPL